MSGRGVLRESIAAGMSDSIRRRAIVTGQRLTPFVTLVTATRPVQESNRPPRARHGSSVGGWR